jgi:hypothetical protein
MYKTNSRFIQHTTRNAALRPHKKTKRGKSIVGPMIQVPTKKGEKKGKVARQAQQDLAEAMRISAERIREKRTEQRSRGGKASGRVLPPLNQD